MSEVNNGQSPSQPVHTPKHHNAKRCPLVIRQRIVTLLAQGDSVRSIARALRVSNNTVVAIRDQEWQQVEARKIRIAAQSERNATLAAERINAKLTSKEDIPLNTLVPVFGVSVDKMLVLRGEPGLTVQHQHAHSHQHELINELHRAFKIAKAEVVEHDKLSAGETSDKAANRLGEENVTPNASVPEKRTGQKEA